jgi:hypothetical protein
MNLRFSALISSRSSRSIVCVRPGGLVSRIVISAALPDGR